MTCPVCAKREPRFPQVCDPCRSWLLGMVREIPEMCGELAALGYVQRDRRHKWIIVEEAGTARRVETEQPADPVAHFVVSGPVPGAGKAPKVSGTADRGLPSRFDLLGPPDTRSVVDRFRVPMVRTGEKEWVTAWFGGKTVRQQVRRRFVVLDEHGVPLLVPSGDQVGGPSVAAVMRGWVVEWWEDHRGPLFGERLPNDRRVTASARWLQSRLQWACDELDSVGVFAGELHDVHLALRRALGLTDPKPEHCEGVPCKSCDVKQLYRLPGGEWIECEGCGRLLSEKDYEDWVKLNSSARCGRRNGDERNWWWCARLRHHDGDCHPAEVVVPAA